MIFPFSYKVIALHSILSTHDQAAAFTLPPPGVRKVKSSPHMRVPSLRGDSMEELGRLSETVPNVKHLTVRGRLQAPQLTPRRREPNEN